MTISLVEGLPMRVSRRWNVQTIAAALFALFSGAGCLHTGPTAPGCDMSQIAYPPAGTVPTELNKITLPPYVIEAPDILLIEVVQQSQVQQPISETDPKKGTKTVTTTDRLPVQPISGNFLVGIDGSVSLGYWGTVPVAGLTREQAADAIRRHLAQHPALTKFATAPESLIVIVDVVAYNSKRYYVIFDRAGFGEMIYPFPVTGSETVLDAISNVYGLTEEASKRNIWVARRTPHAGQPWQILPVDWVGITQHGIAATNYQVLPGDRIYVKAQKLVALDHYLARIIAPMERVSGIILLGANAYNQVSGRGLIFGP